MPAYNSNATTGTPLQAIYPGGQAAAVFSAEKPTSGTLSQQIVLGRPYFGGQSIAVAMEVEFDSNPGAFEYDLCSADTDVADAYVAETSGALTTASGPGPNGQYYARLELNVKAMFIAVKCKTQNANSVNSTVKLSC